MTSPDLSGYVDLTLYDKNPQDIFQSALAALRTRLPTYVAYEGNIDVVLLEEFALEAAEAAYALNRLPGTIMQILLTLFGVERFEGAPPTVNVTFHLLDALGHTVPAGTRVQLDLGAGLDPMTFATDGPAEAVAGETAVTVAATGDRFTAAANGLPSSSGVVVVDSIFFVDSAELDSSPTGGIEPEGTPDWLGRGVTTLQRLNATLVQPQHFTLFALLNPLVTRAFTIDSWNADTASAEPGYLTTAVYGPSGPVSDPDKAALEDEMRAATQANLSVSVVDPTITAVDVVTTVKASPGYVAADVQASVEAALAAYLSPQTWPWSGTVYVNELLRIIGNVTGVDHVVSLTSPAADVPLTGVAPLAELGDLSAVTVT